MMKYEAYIGEVRGDVASPQVGLTISGTGIFKVIIIVIAINDWMEFSVGGTGSNIKFRAKNTEGPQVYEFYIRNHLITTDTLYCNLDRWGNQLDTVNSEFKMIIYGPKLQLDY